VTIIRSPSRRPNAGFHQSCPGGIKGSIGFYFNYLKILYVEYKTRCRGWADLRGFRSNGSRFTRTSLNPDRARGYVDGRRSRGGRLPADLARPGLGGKGCGERCLPGPSREQTERDRYAARSPALNPACHEENRGDHGSGGAAQMLVRMSVRVPVRVSVSTSANVPYQFSCLVSAPLETSEAARSFIG
jgi:hypothetical protein